jgi:hypothetical protein
MDRKMKIEKSLRAPMPLADEELSIVAGAKRGHGRGPKLAFRDSPVTNIQTNVSGPIIQIAAGNGGDVTQVAGVLQSNSVSF